MTFTAVTVLNRAVLPSTTITGNLEVRGRVEGDLSASLPTNLTLSSLTVSGGMVAGSLAVQRGTALGTQLAPGQVALTVQAVAAADQLRVGRNATMGRLDVERVTALRGNVYIGTDTDVAHLVVSGGMHGTLGGSQAAVGWQAAGLRQRLGGWHPQQPGRQGMPRRHQTQTAHCISLFCTPQHAVRCLSPATPLSMETRASQVHAGSAGGWRGEQRCVLTCVPRATHPFFALPPPFCRQGVCHWRDAGVVSYTDWRTQRQGVQVLEPASHSPRGSGSGAGGSRSSAAAGGRHKCSSARKAVSRVGNPTRRSWEGSLSSEAAQLAAGVHHLFSIRFWPVFANS